VLLKETKQQTITKDSNNNKSGDPKVKKTLVTITGKSFLCFCVVSNIFSGEKSVSFDAAQLVPSSRSSGRPLELLPLGAWRKFPENLNLQLEKFATSYEFHHVVDIV